MVKESEVKVNLDGQTIQPAPNTCQSEPPELLLNYTIAKMFEIGRLGSGNAPRKRYLLRDSSSVGAQG